MISAIRRVVTLCLLVAASLATSAATPAQVDCVRAGVTYTSPTGSSTSVGGSCLASTPYPSYVEDGSGMELTAAGQVSYTLQVPAPLAGGPGHGGRGHPQAP